MWVVLLCELISRPEWLKMAFLTIRWCVALIDTMIVCLIRDNPYLIWIFIKVSLSICIMQGLANAIKGSASKPQDEKFAKFAVHFMRQAIEDAILALKVRSQE